MKTVGYRKGTLEIEFPDGDVYQYFDVPPLVYLQFIRAESMGAFFSERPRPLPVRGPALRVTPF